MTTPIRNGGFSCFFCCLANKERVDENSLEKEPDKIEANVQETKSEKFIINDPFHDPLDGL